MMRHAASCRLGAGSWLAVVTLVGCDPADDGCIESARLWDAPPPGPICVLGDLVLEGRGPEEMAVLAWVEEIEGSLLIHDNSALEELPAWPALTRIGGSLSISHNLALTTVRGFPVLEDLSHLYVAENPQLDSFVLGNGVNAVDSLFFALNASLTELAEMAALTRVTGDVRFTHNSNLANLELPGLAEVGGDFIVADNPKLQTAEFPSLRRVDTWSITGNLALESLAGFAALEHVRVAILDGNDALEELTWAATGTSWLMVVNNARLERIEGSASALAAGGNLTIAHNPALRTIAGFAGAEALGYLSIEENEALLEISGLAALARVGYLQIIRNAALASPAGWFPTLAEVSQDLSIFGNTSLMPTVVEALLSRITVGGAARVGDNQGEDTALDPCPWTEDGVCDAAEGPLGRGTELCLIDLKDCGVI